MNKLFDDLIPPSGATSSAPAMEGEAPPPYGAAVEDQSAVTNWGSPQSIAPTGYIPKGMKLSYMDFVPALLKKRFMGKSEYEPFSLLLQRANQWLEDHYDLHIVSCETVTWFGDIQTGIFSDSSEFKKLSKTTYLRGLRLWYMANTIPSPSRAGSNVKVINCKTFPCLRGESFSEMLNRVNQQLEKEKSLGFVLHVETLRLHAVEGLFDPDLTFWKEAIGTTNQVMFALRVFVLLAGTQTKETIGYQDFVPSKTNRSKENKGYELYADVMDRAARWIARQQGVRFVNVQTLNIKIKKNSSFEERCIFTDHGGRPTLYLTIIRAFFTVPQGDVSHINIKEARLSYRTFTPSQTSAVAYEETRTMLERINQWLQITGANLFAVETVPVRQTVAHSLASEATYVPNADSSQQSRYLFSIRIYANGDYVEPPGASSLVVPQVLTYVYK